LNGSPIKLERAIQLTGTPGAARQRHALSLLAPLGFGCAQHWQTPRPSVERIHRKALLPFGSQQRISRIQHSSADGSRMLVVIFLW
jgi:hypothetical protein